MSALLYATVYAPNDLPTEVAHIASKSLGTVNEASELEYKKHLRGSGALKISINRHHPQAALLVQDRYLIVHGVNGPVGGGFLDEATVDLSHTDGPGEEFLTWTGMGQMGIMRNGRMDATSNIAGGHAPIDGYWDLDEQGPAAGASNGHVIPMLKRALVEMQLNSPSGISVVDHSSWTYDLDTDSVTVPFIPGEVQGANVGDDALSLLAQMSQLGDAIFVMDHLFKLDAHLTYGTDKSGAFGAGTVRFEKGVNVAAAIQRKVRGAVTRTHLIVGGAERTFVTAVDPAYVVGDVVRWGFLSVPQTADPDGLEAAGLAHIEARKRQTDTFTFPQHDHGDDPANGIYEPGVHYDVGDTVSHHTGTADYDANEQASPVAAISWVLKTGDEANGDYEVTPEIGSTFHWDGEEAFAAGSVPGSQHRFELCEAAYTAATLLAYTWDANVAETIPAFPSINQPATTTGIGFGLDPSPEGYMWHTNGTQRTLTETLVDVNAAVTAGQSYRFVSRTDNSGFVVDWLSGAWSGGAAAWTLISSATLSTVVGWANNDMTLVAPSGATAIRLRSTSGTGLNVERVTVTAGSAGVPNDGHLDLVGTGSRASRCGHAHHVLRTTAPTVNDDAAGGYPVTTLWTNTAMGRTYVLTDATAGAAVWVEVGVAAHPSLAAHDTLGLATQAELDTHAGAADPHAVYQKESEKAAVSGYASLGADGIVPDTQLPDIPDQTYRSKALTLLDTGYWRLGEALGTVAAAVVGPNGTYVNAPTLGVTGLLAGDPDTAVTFNGTTQYINAGTAPNVGTSGSWAAWIKTTATSGRIISKRNGGASWDMYLSGALVGLFVDDGAGHSGSIARGSVNDGVRHFVAITNNAGVFTVYVDGVQSGTTNTITSLGSLSNAHALYIGNLQLTPVYFNGTIDEVGIASRALTAAEIADLYAAGSAKYAHYHEQYAEAQAELDAHISDAVDAHDASAISVTPAGGITSTDVQAALVELDGDIAAGGIPATIVDAKGDLIVASAADAVARLAVGGTNGHALVVDSAEALGMKWAAVSGSGGAAGYAEGTLFPSMPAAGDKFFHNTYNMLFFYDGTRWLSTTLYTGYIASQQALNPMSASVNAQGPFPHPSLDIYVETFYAETNVTTTNTGTQYWTLVCFGTTLSTISNAASTWIRESASVNAVVANAVPLTLTHSKVSTPGVLYSAAAYTYRLVGV